MTYFGCRAKIPLIPLNTSLWNQRHLVVYFDEVTKLANAVSGRHDEPFVDNTTRAKADFAMNTGKLEINREQLYMDI